MEKLVNKDDMKHGVCPLEFILHRAYKKLVKIWKILQNPVHKRLVDARKKNHRKASKR